MTYTKLIDDCIATYAIHGTADYMIVDDGKARAALQSAIDALQSKLDTATQSSAHWQHQCTELQAENERMKAQTQTLLYDCNTWAQELKNERRLSFRAERDKLQARLDAMGKGEAVQFLCDATRFKVRQHEGDEAGRIFGLPSELNGRWVALVAADDDCHLKLAAPEALAPLTEDAERTAFEAWVKESAGDLRTFGSGSNKHYLNSAVNNAWGGWKQRAHGIHAKGGQQ